MTNQGGSGGTILPGVSVVEDGLEAPFFVATDTSSQSDFNGGIVARTQGVTASADFGNIPLDVFWTDGSAIQRRALNVNENGELQIRGNIKLLNIITGSVGAANGKYIEIYDQNGNLAGKLPLYS